MKHIKNRPESNVVERHKEAPPATTFAWSTPTEIHEMNRVVDERQTATQQHRIAIQIDMISIQVDYIEQHFHDILRIPQSAANWFENKRLTIGTVHQPYGCATSPLKAQWLDRTGPGETAKTLTRNAGAASPWDESRTMNRNDAKALELLASQSSQTQASSENSLKNNAVIKGQTVEFFKWISMPGGHMQASVLIAAGRRKAERAAQCLLSGPRGQAIRSNGSGAALGMNGPGRINPTTGRGESATTSVPRTVRPTPSCPATPHRDDGHRAARGHQGGGAVGREGIRGKPQGRATPRVRPRVAQTQPGSAKQGPGLNSNVEFPAPSREK
ncbi:hypothetical protein QBC37DRAFT_400792 [Rhypophila decipiens]|uniref:Uncharacterized protein n=1 Tax=Rhypophila decipiens TaxID=261697 RepID=A0AAN7B701_9PEZI|nr:hypothetical protein QBC37DRAFT_400792 [Rhypophila decipiens]